MPCRKFNPDLCYNHQTRRRFGTLAALLFLTAAIATLLLSFNATAATDDLATCYQERDDPDKAISACTAFLDGNSSAIYRRQVKGKTPRAKSQAHVLRGVAYFNKGDYGRALNDFNDAIKFVPSNSVALYNRGNIKTSLGQYSQAIDDYTQAINLNPRYANAFNNRCFAYNARGGQPDGRGDTIGDYEKAANDCRRAIQLVPNQSNFYLGLGNALNNAQDFDGALQNYNLAIQWDAKNAKAFLGRCSVDITRNDFSSAIKDCGVAIDLDASDPDARNNRCWARAVIGLDARQLEEALRDDCDQAVKLQPNDPYSLDSRALAYLKLGLLTKAIADYNKAIADYNRALSFQSDRATSLYGRGIAKKNAGNAVGGNEDIESAKAKDKSIEEEFRAYGIQ
jgi:tetratricopeptide (TPR) repeat protein